MHEVSLEITIILLIGPRLRVQHGAPYVQVIYLYLSFIVRFRNLQTGPKNRESQISMHSSSVDLITSFSKAHLLKI